LNLFHYWSVLSLEKLSSNDLQVLIVAPTREIAIQIQQVCTDLSTYVQCHIEYFVGGFPVNQGVKIEEILIDQILRN
jgi:superfamily II DNA/RNA helicase